MDLLFAFEEKDEIRESLLMVVVMREEKKKQK
jgi:hypothetical protein